VKVVFDPVYRYMPVWAKLASTPSSKRIGTDQTALNGWRLAQTKDLYFVFI
jgi:hypothetical protein